MALTTDFGRVQAIEGTHGVGGGGGGGVVDEQFNLQYYEYVYHTCHFCSLESDLYDSTRSLYSCVACHFGLKNLERISQRFSSPDQLILIKKTKIIFSMFRKN